MGDEPAPRTPLLEWISAAIGLGLTLALLAYLGWQAIDRKEAPPPAVTVVPGKPVRAGPGWVLEITARNASPSPASNVTVRGELADGEASEAVFDYVPGRSQVGGGLFFRGDPRGAKLSALGYADP